MVNGTALAHPWAIKEERTLAGSGRLKPVTIWGYEEPENNLEMSQSFDHAEELLQFSNDVQILISTHSPAFYSLIGAHNSVKGYNVVPSPDGTTLQSISGKELHGLNESLGLMTLVAPYVKEKAELVASITKQAESLAQQLAAREVLVVLVAGQTDAQYLAAALDIYVENRLEVIAVSHIGTVGAGGSAGAGDQNLMRFAKEIAKQTEISHNRVLVMLDCDVTSLPPDEGRIMYRRIPLNVANMRFKRGIENLLPDNAEWDNFYSESEKTDEYGAKTIVRKLSKQLLCNAVCDPNSELQLSFSDRFEGFEQVVNEIKLAASLS